MNVRAIRKAAAVLLLLALSACGQAARPAPPQVTLGYCGTSPQVRPDVVLVDCQNGAITARDLSWSGWGQPVATARGTATVNLCAYEACASGDYASAAIEMTASKIVPCSPGRRAYSRLRYAFPRGSPFKGVPAAAASPGTVSGYAEAAPPASQILSLGC